MKIRFKFFLLPFLLLASSCSSMKGITFTSNGLEHATYFDDSYFFLDNSVYHQELSLASIASAMASIKKDGDYEDRSSYLVDLWNKEGFKDIFINDSFKFKPTSNSIGFGIAHKTISKDEQTYSLLTITPRSGEYEAEWASNFTIGKEGNANGFQEAADQVLDGLESYIKTYSINGPTKLWINGYSRGAAVSNLVAGQLLKRIEEHSFYSSLETTVKDVYAYCFEPPAGLSAPESEAKRDLYKCIHCLINYNDLVPQVPPCYWGFTRYGQEYYYPDRVNDIFFDATERKKMVSNYHFSYDAHKFVEYNVDEWKFFDAGPEYAGTFSLPRESINPSMGRFVNGFVKEFCRVVETREMYTQLVEFGIIDLLLTVLGLNPDIGDKPITIDGVLSMVSSYPFIRELISEVLTHKTAAFASDTKFLLLQLFDANEDNYQAISDLYSKCFFTIFVIGETFEYRKDLCLQFFCRDNLLNIALPHYPEMNYSFLESCDTRLHGNKACKLNDGSYYILHVTNPTEFTLIEHQLNKTVFSYADGKMSSDTLSAEYLANDSINIYLPKNGDYSYNGQSSNVSLYNVTGNGIETLIESSLPQNGIIK